MQEHVSSIEAVLRGSRPNRVAMLLHSEPTVIIATVLLAVDSVGNLVIITLLAAGMLGLIKAAGGINYILQVMTRRINGSRGAMTSIALLVSIVNIRPCRPASMNNTCMSMELPAIYRPRM